MEIILEKANQNVQYMVNQNIQKALKKFQDTKNKEHEKTWKQINELIGALNKHQSERDNTTNTEINELKVKLDNIKEEVTMIWKPSQKRMKQKHKQNTLQNHCSRLEQVEDRLSEPEDKIKIKGKTEELLVN
jgi:hypothetical protein